MYHIYENWARFNSRVVGKTLFTPKDQICVPNVCMNKIIF